MNKYKRLGKNTFLVLIGNLGSKLIGFIMLPFYTNWLSVEDYGTTDLITIYSSLLIGVFTFCIAEAIFIFPKDKPNEKKREYFSSAVFFSLLALFSCAIIFAGFDYWFKNIENSFTQNLWLIYGMIVSTFLQQFFQQFTRSIDKMFVYSITGVVLTVCMAVFAFVLIPGYGVKGYVSAIILSNIVAGLYSFIFSKSYHFFSFHSIRKVANVEMLKYSIPLIPNGIMWWLVGSLNRPIMEKYLGIDAIGIFAVANKFPTIIALFFSVFAYSWQVSVMEEFNKPGYKEFYNRVFKVVFLLLIVLSILMTVFSKTIILLVVDDKFLDAWRYIPILTLAVVFSSVSSFVGTNFSAAKNSKYFFFSSAWGAGASVLFSFIFIPVWGIYGAAIAVVLSYFVMSLYRIKFSLKYVVITKYSFYIVLILLNIAYVLVMNFVDNLLYRILLFTILSAFFIYYNRDKYFEIKKLLIKYGNKNEN